MKNEIIKTKTVKDLDRDMANILTLLCIRAGNDLEDSYLSASAAENNDPDQNQMVAKLISIFDKESSEIEILKSLGRSTDRHINDALDSYNSYKKCLNCPGKNKTIEAFAKWYVDDSNLIESLPIRLQALHIIHAGSLVAGKHEKIITEAEFTDNMEYLYSTQGTVFGFRPELAKRGFIVARQKIAEIQRNEAN